ncbi:hypothetical protein KDA11_06525 [Candidatus Saccharibacteria bacterium]|nr:hypothetical protein [Candidatus Saccharibacteria bacterium]
MRTIDKLRFIFYYCVELAREGLYELYVFGLIQYIKIFCQSERTNLFEVPILVEHDAESDSPLHALATQTDARFKDLLGTREQTLQLAYIVGLNGLFLSFLSRPSMRHLQQFSSALGCPYNTTLEVSIPRLKVWRQPFRVDLLGDRVENTNLINDEIVLPCF